MINRRPHRAKSKRKILLFNPLTGAFHEAVEFTFDHNFNGVIPPIQVNPDPYLKKQLTIDRWKTSAAVVAWLYTGVGDVVSINTTSVTQTHYERLVRNNKPALLRTDRIRHIDGTPWNHRMDNLELVVRKPHQAVTWIAGTRVCLGSYSSKEEALEACNAARAAVGLGPVKPRNRNPLEN